MALQDARAYRDNHVYGLSRSNQGDAFRDGKRARNETGLGRTQNCLGGNGKMERKGLQMEYGMQNWQFENAKSVNTGSCVCSSHTHGRGRERRRESPKRWVNLLPVCLVALLFFLLLLFRAATPVAHGGKFPGCSPCRRPLLARMAVAPSCTEIVSLNVFPFFVVFFSRRWILIGLSFFLYIFVCSFFDTNRRLRIVGVHVYVGWWGSLPGVAFRFPSRGVQLSGSFAFFVVAFQA